MERQERLKKVNRVLIITMILNLSVCILKIVLGLVTGALTITADGLHSLGDSFSNIVGIAGVRLAQRSPDEKFPYGYEKFEAVATLVIASVISITFFEVVKNGIERLLNPQPVEISPLVMFLIGASILVNILIVWYEGGAGRRYNSELLTADSQHSRSDIWVSVAVLVGLVLMNLGLYWLDGVITLVIGLFILRVIWEIIRSTVNILADGQVIDPEEISRVVLAVPGARFCHAVRSRGREDGFYLDLHLGVDPDISVEQAHDEICHKVKLALAEKFPALKYAQIHIEPFNEDGIGRANSVFGKSDTYGID